MTDSILWVNRNIAINIDSISSVHLVEGITKIVFSTGQTFELEGDDSEAFVKYLRQKFDAVPTPYKIRP